MTAPPLQHDIPFSALTTLGVGGPAAALTQASDAEALRRCLDRADASDAPVLLLGGGSNLLVADGGFAGHVIQITDPRIERRGRSGSRARVRVGAGRVWDDFVDWAVKRDLAGVECLSGIPGRVGAAPMQNVGAYGQEVAEVIAAVEAVDRQDGSLTRFAPAECGFGYRTSRFKHGEPDRWIVMAVEFDLVPGGAPALRYKDLKRQAGALRSRGLGGVRQMVLEIRARKSMVLDPLDPDARSAGSFFTNPVVSAETVADVEARARTLGIEGPVPQWPAGDQVKLAAAWLIERAGFAKGFGHGPAGLSTKHTLAIVNRGGATARDVAGLATVVRRGVHDAFGVRLVPEPVFVGWGGAGTDDASAVLDAIDSGDL